MLSEISCIDGFRQYMIQNLPCHNFDVILGHSGNYSIIKIGQNASSTNETCTDTCQNSSATAAKLTKMCQLAMMLIQV